MILPSQVCLRPFVFVSHLLLLSRYILFGWTMDASMYQLLSTGRYDYYYYHFVSMISGIRNRDDNAFYKLIAKTHWFIVVRSKQLYSVSIIIIAIMHRFENR